MFNTYLKYIESNFNIESSDNSKWIIKINNIYIYIYADSLRWEIKDFKNIGRKTSYDLSKEENWSILILTLKLFQKGYKKEEIFIEKPYLTGRSPIWIDIAIIQNNKAFAFIEVKNLSEYKKYIDYENHEKDCKQLFSYIFQDLNIKFGSFYTFDPISEKDNFSTVFLNDILKESISLDDMFSNWSKIWDTNNNILTLNKFDLSIKPLKYSDLLQLDKKIVKLLFNQFLTILRQNSVSDKSNAFDKLINIFLVKVIDERHQNSTFRINDNKVEDSLQFQFIENLDDNVSFLKRINNLYKDGMKEFMNKDIIDYKDDEIDRILKNDNNSEIRQIIDNLRLKKNNAFSFIEVFDDKTFEQNSLILKDIVKLFQNYKFKYANKYQYLGDFFEELLNTSWKQEAGQFFTPMPIVEFIVKSLPINEIFESYLNLSKQEFIPKMIDYACGSGHFLVSYMDFLQKCIMETKIKVKPAIKGKFERYKNEPFSWVKENVCGIEKDYRLSKTTKISGFLNGDGEALIINGDGINKFHSDDYQGTILSKNDIKNEIFDFVIANPPYSVDGFMKNIKKENIDKNDFSLLKSLKDNSSKIEILFIERAWQLLKNNGYAAIILPQSIYTTSDYSQMRSFILKHFKIHALCEFGDQTFSGTTTSPVVLFLQKIEINELNYKMLILTSPKMLFEGSKNEKEFLGYEFSENRNKLGIEVISDNLEKIYSPIVKEFILKGNINFKNQYISIKKINDILTLDSDGSNNLFYTRKNLHIGSDWKNLANLGCIINKNNISSTKDNIKYLEIGDINNSKIIYKSNKNKNSNRICLPGDILFCALAPTKNKITIADKVYKLSNAIFTLHFDDISMRDKVFQYFLYDTVIYKDIQAFLDGFKITYAKINEFNLFNNIYFDINKLNSFNKLIKT